MQWQAHMSQDGVGPAFCHFVYRGRHIYQSGNGSYRYSMVHGNDDVLCVLRSRMRSSLIAFPILLMKVVDVYSEIKDGGRMKKRRMK